jgi:hypothetical protein
MDTEWKDFEEFLELGKDLEFQRTFRILAGYFEGVGVLVKRGFLDPALIDDLMSSDIIRYWEKIESTVIELRKHHNIPQSAEHQEYLYNKIRRIAEEQHPELKT